MIDRFFADTIFKLAILLLRNVFPYMSMITKGDDVNGVVFARSEEILDSIIG